ncbi:transcriptional regulator family: Fungal Specific TF [Penicillium atrosanguineum]|nr:transcriptional regulator family: Fungal Specific TF [Penicillium atrosanguineum]KAJ5120138.1 transcriptional regulator family: Fungal Specific TF [Penicillium atrosanguineum]
MSGKQQLSIVNLLYNADYTGHLSPQSYDGVEARPSKGQGHAEEPRSDVEIMSTDREVGLGYEFFQMTPKAQLEIEKIFIGSFFSNKHYIHPILSKHAFMRRCEQEAWPLSRRLGLFRGATKFGGLYFAVIALGAINASPNETALLDHFCQQRVVSEILHFQGAKFSSLNFAKFYFGAARQALGDFMESSCLETAQALLLMSVFRQNSLQPHSCYMYSGMAVRTAAAIGLASSMSSLPPSARREAKRTWWCIFSHETEMCCSSGRLDSMKELHNYQVSQPKLKANVGDHDPDGEDNDIAMIPVMVSLAQIMSEASHQLYHSAHRSMMDKSHLAMGLDARLLQWKANIPSFLNPDTYALNDPEWAFKQKLVLRLRYYNTRILIHRPFLVASTANVESNEFLQHLHICLGAARTSIQMQYESFMHRIYIRTWWYNTTYALYGSMILLHLILSNFPGLPNDELLEDVEKSLEIFASMDDIIVARRCAEMLREVLEVARACLKRRHGDPSSMQNTIQSETRPRSGSLGLQPLGAPATSSLASSSLPFDPVASLSGTAVPGTRANESQSASGLVSSENTLLLGSSASALGPHDLGQATHLDDEDFFFSLFSQGPEQQADTTRTEMLANLVDPSILENFAFGGQDFSFF